MENQYLGMDPLEALQIKPVNLQGGGGRAMNLGDPTMDAAKMLGTSYLTSQFPVAGPAMGAAIGSLFYGGTTKVPQNYMSGTTMVPQNYMAGIDEIPGQRTAQDTVPAMLSPGEAVIPASAAQDPANQGAIEGMVQEGREDQGMAAQILQSLGLPPEPQLIAMIEDMLAQGIPPELIVEQLQERISQSQNSQEMGSMDAPQAPMDAPQAPMDAPMEQGMGMPQGMYNGSTSVQGPLSGKKQREQQKFDSDEYRKDAAFQSDQQRKNEMHGRKMNGE